jgi:hypothetical protein
MVGHGAKFGQKMEQAIAALLAHRNMEEAAHAVGVSTNTLKRWTKEPEFDAALRDARHTAFLQSIARLQEASGAAVTTLLRIMLDSNVPAGIRLRAIEIVLERAAQANEKDDIEARLAELERAVASAKSSRKRSAVLILPSTKSLPGPATSLAHISAPHLDNPGSDVDGVE